MAPLPGGVQLRQREIKNVRGIRTEWCRLPVACSFDRDQIAHGKDKMAACRMSMKQKDIGYAAIQ